VPGRCTCFRWRAKKKVAICFGDFNANYLLTWRRYRRFISRSKAKENILPFVISWTCILWLGGLFDMRASMWLFIQHFWLGGDGQLFISVCDKAAFWHTLFSKASQAYSGWRFFNKLYSLACACEALQCWRDKVCLGLSVSGMVRLRGDGDSDIEYFI